LAKSAQKLHAHFMVVVHIGKKNPDQITFGQDFFLRKHMRIK